MNVSISPRLLTFEEWQNTNVHTREQVSGLEYGALNKFYIAYSKLPVKIHTYEDTYKAYVTWFNITYTKLGRALT